MSKKANVHSFLIILILLTGGIGIVLAILYPLSQTSLGISTRLIVTSFLMIDAICYFVAAWGVHRRIKWIYALSIALFLANALATIFDEIGVYDVLASILNIILLVLLVTDNKKWGHSNILERKNGI